MRTLAPVQTFLRVTDKYFPAFVLEDQHLSAGATLLYLNLFRLAEKDGCCWPSQTLLAKVCKSSVRSVQGYINKLVELGYIQIERVGTHNVYRLLLSARVEAMILHAGVDTISLHRPPHEAKISSSAQLSTSTFSQHTDKNPTSSHGTVPVLEDANSAPSDTQILQRQGANSAPSDTQILQRQGANSASNLRVYKRIKNTLLSPLSAPNPTPRPVSGLVGGVSLSAAPAKIEKGKPACVARDVKNEFEALFASWPRKQDKFKAQQTYAGLARSGQLPPLQTLLDVVARFKAEDRAWRNGFAPNLRFWLSGKRWLDEITPVANAGTSSANAPSRSPLALSPDVIAHAQKLYAARERHGPAVLSDARQEKTPLTRAADTLCRLWPHEDRGKIMSCLVLANIRGVSPDWVMSKAQEEQILLPVETWFRQVAA